MHAIVKEGDHSKECVEAYKNLAQCYKEKRIYQLNACHEKRKLLDKCLDAEYEERYAKNQEEAGRVNPKFNLLVAANKLQEQKRKERREMTAEEKAKQLEKEGNKL